MQLVSEARVATDVPRRYLGQLCKHFQHRLPVELTEPRAASTSPWVSAPSTLKLHLARC